MGLGSLAFFRQIIHVIPGSCQQPLGSEGNGGKFPFPILFH